MKPMLFNSYAFILVFLPATLLLYHGCRFAGLERGAIAVLTLLSLVFYGWWNPQYLLLLVPMVVANHALANAIGRTVRRRRRIAALLLGTGVALDLAVLGYYKYANFFIQNVGAAFGRPLVLVDIVLPLGISFFTFQMIASLCDVYRGTVERFTLIDFALFVTFFPQLIAGPIVHHGEVLPQFRRAQAPSGRLVAMGLTIFVIGLGKKVLLADTAAAFVGGPFAAAAVGPPLDALSAWSGALAYTAQLYFDFSGYSDMAIGAGLLFGIRLPVNFASPYKAASIVEFWRRWHITLSRFLRDYLYVPLGGNRLGTTRRYANLFLTMLLGGLWHGAGWTFVAWGALHGLYLVANHGWRALTRRLGWAATGRTATGLGTGLTFLAVVVGWVFFRAAGFPAALRMLGAMSGANGLAPHPDSGAATGLLLALLLLALAMFAPNTQELTGYVGPEEAHERRERPPSAEWAPSPQWQPTMSWGVAVGAALALALMSLSQVSEFLYFQF